MDLARATPPEIDLEAELLAAYPGLTRRLTLVLRNASEAEDVAQTAFARALEHRADFSGGDVRAWFYTSGLRDITESIEYLLAVLNSTLLTYYAVAHSPIFQGGYHKFSKGYIDALPIRRIDPNLPADMAAHDELEALAIERMRIEEDDSAATPHDKLVHIRRAAETEAAIDGVVFSLYGISSEGAVAIQAAERKRLAGTPDSPVPTAWTQPNGQREGPQPWPSRLVPPEATLSERLDAD